jgi:outer membrane biosynthesis protein TonB
MSKRKIGTTAKGCVILTIGYQEFLVSSKTKALAIMSALIDAPKVSYAGHNRYSIGEAPDCKIESVGTIRFVAPEPEPIEPPAPKPEPSKPAPAPPKPPAPKPPIPPEPEPQMLDLRPVSKRTAHAQLALIVRSIDAPALPARNMIALPDRARPEHQQTDFRLEMGGGR